MDAQEQTFERLLMLEDIWAGQGRAEYPSIPTFQYREALTLHAVPGQPRLFALQRTQKKTAEGEWVESHWESGFLRALPDGRIEWLNAQNGGRVEVLLGTLQETEDALILDLKSTLVGNDARMGETTRKFTLTKSGLDYSMQMSMNHTPALTPHLTALLARFVDKSEVMARLEKGRAEFLEQLACVPSAQLDTLHIVGEWSVKDLLAHFIAHEQRALDELTAATHGKQPPISSASADDFNAQAIQAYRAKSYDQVRSEWNSSFAQIVRAVQPLSDADFEPFSPVCILLEDTIDGALGNNTYEHYAEHAPALERWLAAR